MVTRGLVKTALLCSGFAGLVLATEQSALNRKSIFASIDRFVTAIKTFQPSANKGELTSLFTIPEMSAGDRGKPVIAPNIKSCETIWSDEKSALLFVTAKPPTVGTDSHIGVLFLLLHRRDGWRIADLLRFTAMGKDSGISAKLTAFAAIRLGSDGFDPVVTINEVQGGRGYAYELSASYKFTDSKLQRLDLK